MERLTYRTELGVSIDKNEDCPTCNICWNCDIPPRKCEYIDDVLEKLANYEDLEEQGRLISLPCKVGDTVYYFEGGYYKNIKDWKIVSIKVTEFNIKVNRSGKLLPLAMIANGTRYPMSSIGKTVFLTKSEAEAKLKELRGGENGSME